MNVGYTLQIEILHNFQWELQHLNMVGNTFQIKISHNMNTIRTVITLVGNTFQIKILHNQFPCNIKDLELEYPSN